MSVISGQASGSANTASYHVSRSLWLGKHSDTWMLCDLLPAHGEDALVRKTPLTNPCRSSGIRSKKFSIGRENQSTRIEALSKLTELFKCCRCVRRSKLWRRLIFIEISDIITANRSFSRRLLDLLLSRFLSLVPTFEALAFFFFCTSRSSTWPCRSMILLNPLSCTPQRNTTIRNIFFSSCQMASDPNAGVSMQKSRQIPAFTSCRRFFLSNRAQFRSVQGKSFTAATCQHKVIPHISFSFRDIPQCRIHSFHRVTGWIEVSVQQTQKKIFRAKERCLNVKHPHKTDASRKNSGWDGETKPWLLYFLSKRWFSFCC